jgi:hypothetical protein
MHVEDDRGPPGPVRGLEPQAVVGRGLHEVRWLAALALDRGAQGPLVELQVAQPLGHEPLGLGEKCDLGQPVRQQRGMVGGAQRHSPGGRRAVSGRPEQLAHRREPLLEDSLLACGLDLELQLARVLDPAVHRVSP